MRPVFEWSLGSRSLALGKRTLVMGVINVTPDSFSDGGVHFDRDRAVEYGLRLLEDGADIVDVGGESTRPGAKVLPSAESDGGTDLRSAGPQPQKQPVSEQEELQTRDSRDRSAEAEAPGGSDLGRHLQGERGTSGS